MGRQWVQVRLQPWTLLLLLLEAPSPWECTSGVPRRGVVKETPVLPATVGTCCTCTT